MTYDPSTDFLGLWRSVLGGVEKAEMPGLDWWVLAMGRAGLINVVFSEIAPTTNQETTAWFKTAHPSYAAEGALYLWDAKLGTYVPATPELFFIYLMMNSQDDLLAIWPVIGVPPDSLGKDGDYAVRLDDPGGIYGPKAGGHWPAEPLPGTSYSQISKFLDWLGTDQGDMVFRGPTHWEALTPGNLGTILHSGGPNANPFWSSLTSTDLDELLGGGVQGDIIYRDAIRWARLPASTNGYLLTTHGAAQNPSWSSISTILDTFLAGAPVGSIIYRHTSSWWYLPPGTPEQVLATTGPGGFPYWSTKVGPQGPQGPGGPQGPQGPQGPAGATGGGGSVPGNLYPVGALILAIDGTALAGSGGGMGLGAVAAFNWPGSGPTNGYLFTAANANESNIVPGWSIHPPGNWMITSYLGGTRATYSSSGNEWPDMASFITTVVRVS